MCGGGSAVEEEAENQENIKGGLWYARTIFTICVLALTIVLGMAGTIKIGIDNTDLIAQKDAGMYKHCFNLDIFNPQSPSLASSS